MREGVKSVVLGVLLSVLFLSGGVVAGTITKANTFTTATQIPSAEVNENFDDLYAEVNGELDDANVDELSPTEILGGAATLTGATEQGISRTTEFTGVRTENGTVVADCETLEPDDTTPDVSSGAYCYTTASTGEVSVVDFDGAIEGQVFWLNINEIYTKIVGNTAKIATADWHRDTNGADDLVAGAIGTSKDPLTGDERVSRWTRFISVGGVWQEMETGGGCCTATAANFEMWIGYAD